jgi:hypothetical protein
VGVVVVSLGCMVVLVLDHDVPGGPDEVEHPPDPGDGEHPPALHAEVAAEPDQRPHDVETERDEREPDDAPRCGVDAGRDRATGQDGDCAEGRDHEHVPQRVHGCEQQRAAAFRLRARDVGDRGDVVDVEAVPEPRQEDGRDDAERQTAP